MRRPVAQGTVALLLVYEPSTTNRNLVPLARLTNPFLAIQAAKIAVSEAQIRADTLAKSDALLAEVERAEVARLRQVLSILVPGFSITSVVGNDSCSQLQ
jgi:hypothetical protein